MNFPTIFLSTKIKHAVVRSPMNLYQMNIRLLLFFLLLLFPFLLQAQNFPEPMRPARAVNDFAGLLSSEQQAQLEQKLRNYNDSTSSALVIVTVNSLEGMDVAQYTTELAQRWGVGREDVDNGLVILVGEQEKQINISTGYGLEGAVPDALAKRIIEQQMKPRFRQGDFYGGLNAATDTIMKLASGEYTAEDVGGGEEMEGSPWFALLIVLFLIIFPILQIRRFKKRNLGSSKRSVGWLPMLLLMNGMNRGSGNSYGDFRGGGGTFGGGSGGGGGGFGGFGGGGFGGGGASGGW